MRSNLRSKLSILLILLMAMLAVSAIASPTVFAQEPIRKKTFPYINAIPNPVGVNQEVLFHTGILTPHLHGYGWEVEVIITKPDGTKETIKRTTDSTGGTGVLYVPDQVGTYIVQTHFPEQTVPVDLYLWESGLFLPAGSIMEESYSDPLELIVQREPVPIYPAHALPKEYWVRPIDSQLREWDVIGGNWLYPTGPYRNLVAPYNEEAPETSHVLWAKTLRGDIGALVGGFDGHGYKTGDAYEGEWLNPIIISGVLYYNKYWSAMSYDYGGPPYPGAFDTPPGVVAVDLHTGEVLWERDDIRVSYGMIYYYSTPNQHGAIPYIVDTSGGTTWKFYRASTGDWEFTIENVPSGGYIYHGPNGELMELIVNTQNRWMALWNSTAIPELAGFPAGAGSQMWRPYKATFNGTKGIMWNVSIPAGLGVGAVFGLTPYAAYDDRVVGISWNTSKVIVWGLSLKRGEEGKLLFKTVWDPPAEWSKSLLTIHYAGQTNDWRDGVVALFCKEERRFYGFSTVDGSFLWRTEPEHYLNAWGWGPVEHSWVFAYGKLYSTGVSGILYCYDLKTGKTLWTYKAVDPYNEFLFNTDWWMWICFIADGKVYMGYAEHSPMDPKPRGGPFICVDAMTGDEVWRVDGMFMQSRWGGRAIIGDSIMVTLDHYDSRIYAVGKGPSKLTVTAPLTAVTLNSPALIRGSVMDVSPGTNDPTIKLRFPNGVPAVADEDMSEWMLYVYKQFERPANVKGVTVKLEAVDPNGNYRMLGTTTTDPYGNYAFQFTPDVEGQWMIIATFEGSKSYYPSTETTYMLVTSAPPTPATPEQVAQQVSENVTPLQELVQSMQPWIITLLILVIIAILIGIYNIYEIKRTRK